MKRNWYGKRIYNSESKRYHKITDADIRSELVKMVIFILLALIYFYFVIIGKTV